MKVIGWMLAVIGVSGVIFMLFVLGMNISELMELDISKHIW